MSMNDLDGSNARRREKAPLDIKRMIGIGSSLLVVAFFAYWMWGVGTRKADTVAVVEPQQGELRTVPADAGGETVDYQGNQVNGVLEGNPPALTNNVELAPEPTALDDVDPAEIDPSTQTVNIPIDAPDANGFVGSIDGINAVPSPARRPELLYIPPKDQLNPITAEARPVGASGDDQPPVPVASAGEIVESAASLPEIAVPAGRPVEEPVEEEVAPELVAEVAPAPAPAPAPAQTTPSGEENLGPRLPSGTPLIQLAANTKLIDTQNQWKKLQAANNELLGNKALYVEQKIVNGKLYYRLRVSGFATNSEAQAACATLLSRNVQCLFVRAE